MDDSTIIQVDPSSDTPPKDTVNLAQKCPNIFAGAARSIDGKFIVEKIKWDLMDFKWNP